MFDYEQVLKDLEKIHHDSSYLEGYDYRQVSEYIYVGEYGLALDTISYDYISNDTPMSENLFEIFKKLVKMMDLLDDPEWNSIKELMDRQSK